MADDKTKVGGSDRKRINMSEDFEVNDWSRRFGVSTEQLREAVTAVGTWADAVERHLKNQTA